MAAARLTERASCCREGRSTKVRARCGAVVAKQIRLVGMRRSLVAIVGGQARTSDMLAYWSARMTPFAVLFDFETAWGRHRRVFKISWSLTIDVRTPRISSMRCTSEELDRAGL